MGGFRRKLAMAFGLKPSKAQTESHKAVAEAEQSTRDTDEKINKMLEESAVKNNELDRRIQSTSNRQVRMAKQVLLILDPERSGAIK